MNLTNNVNHASHIVTRINQVERTLDIITGKAVYAVHIDNFTNVQHVLDDVGGIVF